MISYKQFKTNYQLGKRPVERVKINESAYIYRPSKEPVPISEFDYRVAYSRYVIRSFFENVANAFKL